MPSFFDVNREAYAVAAVLCCLGLSGTNALATDETQAEPPYKETLDRIAAARDALSGRVDELHRELSERARAEDPELLAKLDRTPPKQLPTGYGLLPPVVAEDPDDPALADNPPETRYDLRALSGWVAREHDRCAEIVTKLRHRSSPLDELIDDYEYRAENFRRIDEHVLYHEFWQEAARDAGFYARQAEFLNLYRESKTAAGDRASDTGAALASEKLEEALFRFQPAPGLRIERGLDVGSLLRVPIATDVDDDRFLAIFTEAVDTVWNQSQAQRQDGLRIEIDWDRRTPEDLYPEGAPARGDAIDTDLHRERFGPGTLVLTTGAVLTYGEDFAVFLGTDPVTRHVLAHEFAHLLGFADGYVRAFEGSPDDPWGVVIHEIRVSPPSILGAPERGRVTPAMVRRVLAAYGEGQPVR
jgi:hypothetical protein